MTAIDRPEGRADGAVDEVELLAAAIEKHLAEQAEPWSFAGGVARDATIRDSIRAAEFVRQWFAPVAAVPEAGERS